MMSSATESIPESSSPDRYFRQAPKKSSRTCSRDGSNILGLGLELAKVADDALRASGLAREARVAAVKDEPVVRVLHVFGRGEFYEPVLDFARILARGQAGSIGNPEDMGIDRNGRLAERGV